MPYVQAGTPQKWANLPGVQDVFHSSNVYANNVAIALWQDPAGGTSSAFANDIAVDPVTIDPDIVAAVNAKNAAYVANPRAFAMPSSSVAQNAVEPNYQGTPDQVTTSTGELTVPVADGIVPWLTARVEEAGRGLWSRTYQSTGVSNPNIMSIWSSIGLRGFTNDTVPWCMGFVNFALKQTGYRWCREAGAIAIKNGPTRWNATEIPLNQGQPGDIALWDYGGPKHVNFVYTVNKGRYTFAGGNQGGKNVNNNNPSHSTVSISWPGGWSVSNNKPGSTLVGLWRPSKT
jgi:uncharacterized protein (TIGR02594 family)